jgi:hypothetical protein
MPGVSYGSCICGDERGKVKLIHQIWAFLFLCICTVYFIQGTFNGDIDVSR